ncbi:hypothetical protein D3C72_1533870 [compost metagenome]|jgi:hypothetical protein
MPQPIRNKSCHIELVGLGDLPEHAALLGQIVAVSGALEARLGWLLAFLSGASATVAIPMFHAVASTEAQRGMLLAAAEQTLAGAELDEFRDLMADFRTRYGERNRLVHNLWGRSNDHPDKAVWAASKDIALGMTPIASAMKSGDFGSAAKAEMERLPLKCSLYSIKDLEQSLQRIVALRDRVNAFLAKLRSSSSEKSSVI